MSVPDDLFWPRWDEVDGWFEAALDLAPSGQAALLERLEANDAEMAALLRRLLRRAAESAPRAETPAPSLLAEVFPTAAAEPDLVPGSSVGRWTILRQHGRGGMATVYEAERADGVYTQRAALKVLRRGLDTEDLVRRFVRERQILSSLTHPNIARLLDGGSTTDGRPYLVMEFVEGEPITKWVLSRALDVPQRLQVFLGVADAVHAAHRQLVVHRDIKPSNVLVDENGRVRLLDFGIARLLEDEGESERTIAGSRVLTPDYASPEQLRDEAITTASDVYQLGLLLHEALTGLQPKAGQAPMRPSRVALDHSNDHLARQLSREIDLILDKALRNEADQRYSSADEFATDIRRHLRGLPIHAHPESAAYRVRKFLGRNPFVLPGSAAIVIALVAFVSMLAVQNRRLERERDAAAAASRAAQQTQALLLDVLGSPDPYAPADPERGRGITVVEALRLGAERIDGELGSDPVLHASLLSTIGSVFNSLGQYDESVEVLERAIALRQIAGDSTSSDFSRDLGMLSGAFRGSGEEDSSIVQAEHRLELERARKPREPLLLASALTAAAYAVEHTDPLNAVALQEEAVEILRESGGRELADALRTLADSYREIGRHQQSELVARQAVDLFDAILGPEHASTAMALHTLGQTLGERGRFAEAAALLERSLGVFERDLGTEHPFTLSMRNNLGVVYLNADDPANATAVFREVLAGRTRVHGPRSSAVAGAMQNLATSLLGQGRLPEAESFSREAESLYRDVLPAGSIVITFPMLTRSEIQLARGDFQGARATASAVRAALDGRLPPAHPAVLMADCRLGRALAGLGLQDRARSTLDSALALMQTAEGVRDRHLIECRAARDSLEMTATTDSLRR